MTLENINKPNPKHYKFELRNVPVIIDGKEMVVDSLQLETRYILKDLLNDANLTHEQAFWYGNMGKGILDCVKSMMNQQLILRK